MNNIFKNAYFGKPYRTEKGDKVLFLNRLTGKDGRTATFFAGYDEETRNFYLIERDELGCNNHPDDIIGDVVSEWQEPIDEENLEKIASEIYPDDEDNEPIHGIFMSNLKDIYKSGYRRALEDKQ